VAYVSQIVDFYMLDYLAMIVKVDPQIGSAVRPWERRENPESFNIRKRILADQVSAAKAEVESGVGVALRDYAFMAAFGEARHAWDMSQGDVPEDLPKGVGRGTACKEALRYDPVANWRKLYDVFEDGYWHNGYGGHAWAQIVRAVHLFEINKAVGLDYLLDLQHNGGRLLDKSTALHLVGLNVDMSESEIANFLEWKKHNDYLDLPGYYAEYLSANVARLAMNVLKEFRGFIRVYLSRNSEADYDGGFPPHAGILWGDEELSDNLEPTVERCCNCDDPKYSEYNGQPYCWDCYHDTFGSCAECGGRWYKSDLHEVDGGDEVCFDCLSNYYTECGGCGKYIHNGQLSTTADDSHFCAECYDEQNDCIGGCEAKLADPVYVPHAGYVSICPDCMPGYQADHGYYEEQIPMTIPVG
jgi:hypothetical protein